MCINNVTGVVLAGGRAIRMGGRDKGLIEISGKTIVERVASQLSSQVSKVLINANRNLEQYQGFGYRVVADYLENYQGPLAGMAAALKDAGDGWILTAPCDGPFLAQDYASKMLATAKQLSVHLVVATDGERLQPVYALINKQLFESLEAYLQSGERKIDRWYSQHSYSTVSFSDELSMFTNVNTPEQLREVEQSIGTQIDQG
ncbi:MAG: molybdenum cofactor guanylyltransferase MobA [bacterium]